MKNIKMEPDKPQVGFSTKEHCVWVKCFHCKEKSKIVLRSDLSVKEVFPVNIPLSKRSWIGVLKSKLRFS